MNQPQDTGSNKHGYSKACGMAVDYKTKLPRVKYHDMVTPEGHPDETQDTGSRTPFKPETAQPAAQQPAPEKGSGSDTFYADCRAAYFRAHPDRCPYCGEKSRIDADVQDGKRFCHACETVFPAAKQPAPETSAAANHSPLPWRRAGGMVDGYAIIDANNQVVISQKLPSANASFIVQACNDSAELERVKQQLEEQVKVSESWMEACGEAVEQRDGLLAALKGVVIVQDELRLKDERDFVKGQAWLDLVGNARDAIAAAQEGK